MFISHNEGVNSALMTWARSGSNGGLGNSDLSHVTTVGEIVVARAHVTVLPRLRDAKAWRVAGGWGVV